MISFISHNFIFVCINVFAQFCFLTSRNACLGRCFMWMWCECDVSDIFQKHEYVMWCECDVRCSCFIERLSEARWCDCMNTIRHASQGWHAQPSWRVTSMLVCNVTLQTTSNNPKCKIFIATFGFALFGVATLHCFASPRCKTDLQNPNVNCELNFLYFATTLAKCRTQHCNTHCGKSRGTFIQAPQVLLE